MPPLHVEAGGRQPNTPSELDAALLWFSGVRFLTFLRLFSKGVACLLFAVSATAGRPSLMLKKLAIILLDHLERPPFSPSRIATETWRKTSPQETTAE